MAPTPELSSSASDPPRVTAAASKTFKQIVSVKLDDTNYLQWKQQVEGVLRGTKMVKLVVSPQIPPVFLSDADREAGKENPAYTEWEEQDSLLCTWILSTISASLLSRFVLLRHSWQVWDEIHTYCFTQMKTRSRQLRSELRSITKGTRTIAEFFVRIRSISEALMSIGDPVSKRDLIEIVLESLPEEFDPIVASVNGRPDVISLDELESQLLTQEARNEKFKKALSTESASVNLAQNIAPESQTQSSQSQYSTFPEENSNGNLQGNSQYPNSGSRGSNFRGRGFRGGRSRGRSGRGGGRGYIQCQICFKTGHDASICYHRFSGSPTYEGYGASNVYGASGMVGPPPNVWMQGMQRNSSVGNPYRAQYPAPSGNQRPAAPQAYFAGFDNSNSFSNVWYPDSGATNHVTPDASHLMDSVPFSGADQVHIGNGQGLPISSIGSMHFTSPFEPHTTLSLHNLLLVPSITKNLVSVSQFARDNNVYFEFHPDVCFVKSQVTSKTLLKGSLGKDGLYQFDQAPLSKPSTISSSVNSLHQRALPSGSSHSLDISKLPCNKNSSINNSSSSVFNSQCNNVATATVTPSLYSIWHCRLGHPHHEVLKAVTQLCNVSLPNKNLSDFCSACCLGKVHRLPSSASKTPYTTPLELIFCDLWGPSPVESFNGYTYFLTCVDAYSRYTWIYPLKMKSHTLITFQNFKSMVELQFKLKIKAVQTDGGGEFRPFTKYLNELGILHRFTCPHAHHQNGSVERKHRHIVETGLTLLAQAKMPLKFWDHAFLTATYLINRLPSHTLQNKSPFFLLKMQFPDYKFLKCFGCACYPFLRPYNHQKVDFHSRECIFLGYSPSHKGYQCLDSSGKVFISKDVVFNEIRFPYSEIFPSSSQSTVTSDASTLSSFLPSQLPNFTDVSTPPPNLPTQTTTTSSPSPTDNSPVSPYGQHSSPSVHQDHHSPTMSASQPYSPDPVHAHSPDHIFNPTPINVISPSPSLSSDHTPSPSSVHSPPTPPPKPHRIHPSNTHSMATRGKLGIVQPRLHPTLLLTHVEPTNHKQALSLPHWYNAMQTEYNALLKNHTWSLVPLPQNRQGIGCKWVFRVKENPDGSINKYKARLVAKGFHQQLGFDYTETFSPVVKPVTVRTVLTLAVTKHWPIQQLDINNAFLNGILNEEVYMSQPPGFESSNKNLVCKLHKALYGLKQAPRAWFERLKAALLNFGFKSSKCDPSLFTLHTRSYCIYLLVYVDDIIITGSSKSAIHDLVSQLNSKFSLKDLGTLDYFLGIEVHHSPNGTLHLSQTKYIKDLLIRANMDNAKSMASPMASTTKLSKFGSSQVTDATFFRSIVGALQYATITRPEISYAVNKVCQFLSDPLEEHWKAVKRILRYLQGTLDHGLVIKAANSTMPITITGFCDADWASDPDDRRSTSGACIYLGPNLISWWAKKQTLVARSSAEAEYRSLAQASAEIIWIQSLLQELQIPSKIPQIYCDNLSAVSLAHNPVLHSRTKHMELDIFFVREKVLSKSLTVTHVPAQDQWADILTKPLSTSRFIHLRDKLRVFDKTLSLRGEC